MQTFPTFHLKNGEAQLRTNLDYSKGYTLFYFYPKDDTPGCTHQACNLRDHLTLLEEQGVTVVGVSPDDVASHIQFALKYQLPFELLSDHEHRLCDALGIWTKQTLFGRSFLGVVRSSFLVKEGQEIVWEKRNINPKTHLEEVLEALQELRTQEMR